MCSGLADGARCGPAGAMREDRGVTGQSRATWLGHATVLLELAGVRLLTDPVLRDRVTFLRRVGDPAPEPPRVDAVLLSHLHHDHCDLWSLRRLGRDTLLIVPVGAGTWLRAQGFRHIQELAEGRTTSVGVVEVTAVPALHDGTRAPFGPRAAALGYIVDGGGARTYFAGDTDLFEGMRDLGAVDGGLDLALLPVWGWGTSLGPGHMDPDGAAEAVARIGPRIAVPVHWGTLLPLTFRSLHPRATSVLNVPPNRFASAVRATGASCRVVVCEPGRHVTIGG